MWSRGIRKHDGLALLKLTADAIRRHRAAGLSGVELAVSDDHAGLRKAIAEILPEAAWQRCYVHFLRNCLDYLPRKAHDDRLQELRWLYARRNLAEGPARPGGVAHALAAQVSEAHRLGRGEHRRHAHVLPITAAASQTPQEHQHARAAERGATPAHARGAASFPTPRAAYA